MVHETGSFGKSTRRSRSKTATPARREDPTITAADKVFSSWIASQAQNAPQTSAPAQNQRKPNPVPSSSSKNLAQTLDDNPAPPQTRFIKQREPTEVILRGYRSAQQQYAAINHYEQLAGRICEDYSRDPPVESRRYKSELRDPALTRRQPLTAEERAKVNRADGGEHWVKVTFESEEAASAAIYASPQTILGHVVYAERYHGIPPARDEAIPDPFFSAPQPTTPKRNRPASHYSFARNLDDFDFDFAPAPPSQVSTSSTADTATVASNGPRSASSSGTVTGQAATMGVQDTAAPTPESSADSEFCRAIPSVRKARLLPMEQALLPNPSLTQRATNYIPFLRWFNGAMIGSQVPRTETGEFDWNKASLYWKLMWWLDVLLGLFGGEIRDADKDDE